MPPLSSSEIAEFLAEPGHLTRIGVVSDDGMPLVVPAWFIVRNGMLLVTPRERSAWLGYLERDPRACFTVDESRAPNRKVVVRGTVTVVHHIGEDKEWRDLYRDLTVRYASSSWAQAYLDDTRDERRALVGVRLDEAKVVSWRMPFRDGEDPLAFWAPKYYRDVRRRAGSG